MLRTWTRRRMTPPPPDSGGRFARRRAAAAIFLALLLPACGGKDRSENRIKPVLATLLIDLFPGTPDPAVYLVKDAKDPRFPDLETVRVRLHATTPQVFDAFTLEFTYEFEKVQIGDV